MSREKMPRDINKKIVKLTDDFHRSKYEQFVHGTGHEHEVMVRGDKKAGIPLFLVRRKEEFESACEVYSDLDIFPISTNKKGKKPTLVKDARVRLREYTGSLFEDEQPEEPGVYYTKARLHVVRAMVDGALEAAPLRAYRGEIADIVNSTMGHQRERSPVPLEMLQ